METEALEADINNEEEEDPIYRRAEWTVDGTPLTKIRFQKDETGWAYDMGGGKYRLANTPIIGMCTGYGDAVLPGWGDLVSVHGGSDELKYLTIHEKYDKDKYRVKPEEMLDHYKEMQKAVEDLHTQIDSGKGNKDILEHRLDEYLDHMDEVWKRLSDGQRSRFESHRP